VIEDEQAERVRIFPGYGTGLELRDPVIEGDSITATAVPWRGMSGIAGPSVKIALADVTKVETKQFSVDRTMGLALILYPPLYVLACLLTPLDCN
jgi:hypothetical protein